MIFATHRPRAPVLAALGSVLVGALAGAAGGAVGGVALVAAGRGLLRIPLDHTHAVTLR